MNITTGLKSIATVSNTLLVNDLAFYSEVINLT